MAEKQRVEKPFTFYGMRCAWNDKILCTNERGCKACGVPATEASSSGSGEKKHRTPAAKMTAVPERAAALVLETRCPGRMRLSESTIYDLIRDSVHGVSILELERSSGYTYSTIRVAIRRLTMRGLINTHVTPGIKEYRYHAIPAAVAGGVVNTASVSG